MKFNYEHFARDDFKEYIEGITVTISDVVAKIYSNLSNDQVPQDIIKSTLPYISVALLNYLLGLNTISDAEKQQQEMLEYLKSIDSKDLPKV